MRATVTYLFEVKTSDRTLKLTLSAEMSVTSPSVQPLCCVMLDSVMYTVVNGSGGLECERSEKHIS